jgi:hypothetical protein
MYLSLHHGIIIPGRDENNNPISEGKHRSIRLLKNFGHFAGIQSG